MAIQLHKIVEAMTSGTIHRIEKFDADMAFISNNVLAENITSIRCFDIGDVKHLKGMKWIPEIVRLPYEHCWFEFEYTTESGKLYRIGTYCYELNDNIFGTVYKYDDNPYIVGTWCSSRVNEFAKVAVMPNNLELGEILVDYRNIVFVFLSVLNCTNIKRVRVDPPAKLQKSRSKKNKLPLYSYWTLHIKLSKKEIEQKRQNKGNHKSNNEEISRNSPRVHLRRGHIRNYAPSKFTWVIEHEVGDETLGRVEKDYKITIV